MKQEGNKKLVAQVGNGQNKDVDESYGVAASKLHGLALQSCGQTRERETHSIV